MLEIDRKNEWGANLRQWKTLHDKAQKSPQGKLLYSSLEDISLAAKGRLDFCIGNGGKYRFAKLLTLSSQNADAAVLLHSSEENTAIILKQLLEAYRKEMQLPFIAFDLDYEHIAGKEDFQINSKAL